MNYEKPSHLVIWRASDGMFYTKTFHSAESAVSWLSNGAIDGHYVVLALGAGTVIGQYDVTTRRVVTPMS